MNQSPKLFKLFVFFGVLLLPLISKANDPKITIKGQILEAEKKEEVPFATVAIYLSENEPQPVKSGYSDMDGHFAIELPKAGNYFVSIQSMGYDPYKKSIQFDESTDMGTILLKSQVQLLESVVITGEKATGTTTPGAMTFTMDQQGTDDMEEIVGNMPGVEVDFDGNATIRGLQVTYLVNGEESGMENPLQEIPKQSIARMELMTNPPVEFASSGPVINIILKENAKIGNSFRGGLGAGNLGNLRGYTGGSIRKENLTINPWIYYSQREKRSHGSYDQLNHGQRYLEQTYNNNSGFHYGNYGTWYAYKFKDKSELSGTLRLSLSDNHSSNDNDGDIYSIDSTFQTSKNIRTSETTSFSRQAHYENKYRKKWDSGQKLSLRYFFSFNQNLSKPGQYSRITDFTDATDEVTRDEGDRSSLSNRHRIQTKFTQPLGEDMKIVGGYFFDYRLNRQTASYQTQINDGIWLDNPDRRQDAQTLTQSNDMFLSFSAKHNRFGFNAGARYKLGQTDIHQWNSNSQQYDDFTNPFSNLNSSVKFTYDLNEDASENIMLSYRNNVHPPSASQLNPFIDDSNPLWITMGNPDLKNSQNHYLELEYLKVGKDYTLKTGLFGRKVLNSVARYQWSKEDTVYNSFRNIEGISTTGLNVYFQKDLLSNLKLSSDASYTYEYMPEREGTLDKAQTYFYIKGNMEYKFLKDYRISITGRYTSTKLTNNAQVLGYGSMDFNAERKFYDGQAKVYFNVRDVFNTIEQNVLTSTDSFVRDAFTKQETRRFIVGMSFYLNGI